MMSNEPGLDLNQLIRKYVNNTCSREELELILEMAKEPSQAFSDALKIIWEEENETGALPQVSFDRHFNNMMSELRSGTAIAPVKDMNAGVYKPGARRRKIIAIGIAAAFLGLICLTAILLINENKEPVAAIPSDIKKENDIQPGGDRAILTLADGRQILLDSVMNGTLANQGGVRIIKIGGMVTYDKETSSQQVLYNTISTPRGGQYQLELADGTRVWLNAASSITFPTAFLDMERKISIIGEAYFEVAHDPSKPFKVAVNDLDVEVLGTHFNINAYNDEEVIKTTLLEGRVLVKKAGKPVILNPSQQAIAYNDATDHQIIINNNIDVEAVIAWKNGLFNFEYSDINKILREFSRWYDIEVEIRGKLTDKKFFGIVSRNSTLGSVLQALRAGGPAGLSYKVDGKKLIVQTVNKD